MYIKYNGYRFPRIIGAGHIKIFFHKAPKNVICVTDEIGYIILKENLKIGGQWEFVIVDKMSIPIPNPVPAEGGEAELVEVKNPVGEKTIKVREHKSTLTKSVSAMNATVKKDIKKWRAK